MTSHVLNLLKKYNSQSYLMKPLCWDSLEIKLRGSNPPRAKFHLIL